MGLTSRRKGKAGEREAAAILRDLLGVDIRRNLTQSRDGGDDLSGLPGWSIEVKRAARPRLAQWWAQTVEQANGSRPVLLYRVDRQDWRAVLALADVLPGFELRGTGAHAEHDAGSGYGSLRRDGAGNAGMTRGEAGDHPL